MRRYSVLLVLGLLAYGVFLVLRWPAAQLASPLQTTLPGITINGPGGNVVRGQAAKLAWAGAELGRLEWRFDPASLLHARVGWWLRLNKPPNLALRARLELTWNRWLELRNLAGTLPLARLQPLLRRPLPIQGRLKLALNRVRLAPGGRVLAVAGSLKLEHVRWANLPQQALGPFLVQVSTRDRIISARLTDRGGPLRLHATLLLRPNDRYRLHGELAARKGSPAAVKQLLQQLGGDSDDRLRFNLAGHSL